MLDAIGADSIDELFEEIPPALRARSLPGVPPRATEMEVTRLMRERAGRDHADLCFVGAGAYDHHIPAAVWEITTRGEYYSAYTPYQAEASQGTLQLLYEYQSMMAALTGMDVSNASLYDGASAMAEAALMAVRANRKSRSRRLLVAGTVHPRYRDATAAITGPQSLELETLDWDRSSGVTVLDALAAWEGEDIAGVIVQQPNFFGRLEDVDAITDWAHANGALAIAVVNPLSLSLLKPPGHWGAEGADMVCGDGQPLGVPLSSGGPYFGIMACRQKHVRQMPGRIVGRTVDLDGKPGYTLTLQAREQHIRRKGATSNICTNQGLLVTAATIYLSMLGADGLERVAAASHANTHSLAAALSAIDGVSPVFDGPHFHEIALKLDRPVAPVLEALAARGILGGYDLTADYPDLGNALLVCATETKTDDDIRLYADTLRSVLADARVA